MKRNSKSSQKMVNSKIKSRNSNNISSIQISFSISLNVTQKKFSFIWIEDQTAT